MPKRNSINLQNLCFQIISDKVEIMKSHLTCLPYILITEFYERRNDFGLDIKKLPLEIVLNRYTTKLVFKDILHLLHRKVTDKDLLPDHKFNDKVYNGFDKRTDKCIQRVFESCSVNNVTYINLSECESVNSSLQLKLIQHFKQIQIFEIPRFGNDELLTAIASHCPQLRDLTVSFSERVTDKGIESLCSNKEIKIVHLDIYKTNVTAKGCLCALKNLKSLKTFFYSCLNELFEMLKLEMHSTPAYSSIEVTSCLCYLNEERFNIATVVFPNLRTLEVADINFNHIVVRNYLEKVTNLDVQSENLDIYLLGLCCPIVERLQLEVTNFTNLQNDWSIPNHTPFKRLRNLYLYCLGNDIPKKDLNLLLANCHDLDKLFFQNCQTLTDDFFINLIKVNPLYHLTQINIFDCDYISVISLMTMFQMDNFLNEVFIGDCALFNEFEITQLQSYVVRNNLNVVVVLENDE